ncbi:hypothetical protein HYPSUDRAFT_54906 [Hypholoma sublateritium FD-334 SS-4]|uniref:Uncharacterized protein n=1 Tax=Hypholoma sublateritium (strain FD-334 SS-4) TaxID=945553 RepID=A0A0D2NU15_HYPSF|nr:hypothetical protein HYPSUDRAFT_54906 [Hypholoma sublateritium FD-334 SS-4]
MMSAEQLHATRAEQRRLRLAEAEREQAAEEAEALMMTEEQHQILLKPFLSVKAEFTDLDGLRGADQSTIRVPAAPHPRPKLPAAHRDGSRTRSPVKGLFPPNPPPPAPYTGNNFAESSLLKAPQRLQPARSMSLLAAPATTAPLPRRRRAATTTAGQALAQAPMAADSLGSLLEVPPSAADPTPSARARLAALLSHAPAPNPPPRRTARSPPLSPALPALITTLTLPPERAPVVSPGDTSTIRPPARRTRPALPPQVPPPPGLRGWRSADVDGEDEAEGYADDDEADGPPMRRAGDARAYASGVPAWESDAEDEETPRPSPIEGDASPSRRWIRGFA